MSERQTTPPGRLILVRHGQSTWNLENLFTGWTDVELSELGRGEAARAGREVLRERLAVDIAFTSVLKRAIRTLWIMLEEMERMWLPVERSWRLNERHYGALQGLNKAQTVAQYGAAQVKIWRRSYDSPRRRSRPMTRATRASIHATLRYRPRICRRPNRSRTRSRACCPAGMRASHRSCAAGATSWSWHTATACAPW